MLQIRKPGPNDPDSTLPFALGIVFPPYTLRCPYKGDKIRSCYIRSALLGAHKWAEWVRNSCVLRVPNKKDTIKVAT